MSKAPSAKIVFDRPTNTDGFSGGGHSRSADALADAVQQLTPGGGTLGLEGPWGSGKSSVIEMAQDRLNKPGSPYSFHLFTFDLWTHQSDEFRRAVLEELLSFVAASKFSSEFDIQAERDAIRNRKKHVTNENRRRYTFVGLIVVLFLPLLPIFYLWINPTAFSNIKSLGATPWVFLVLLVLAFASVPFLIAGAYKRVPVEDKIQAKTWAQKLVLAASEFLTLSKHVRDETITQWIRDEDPTTVEFHTVFRGLLAKIQQEKRRVVLVLDNVDRLPADIVAQVWSEMRAIIARKSQDERASIVTVVPYDRQYVLEAFSSKDVGDPTEHRAEVIEKTFDRVIKVSPPVPSDWDGYLDERLREAFQEQISAGDREVLFRLLRYKLQVEETNPTPRRIVSYVNDIGGLWTQWGHAIPVGSIGLYVLHRVLIDRSPGGLAGSEIIDERFLHILNEVEWRQQLAALAFNVEPELANQVLLGQRIANAIVAADAADLVSLSKVRGFAQIFQEELATAMADLADARIVDRVALNLGEIVLTDGSANSAWRDLKKALKRLSGMPLEAENAGLLSIVEHQRPYDSAEAAGDLMTLLGKSLPTTDSIAAVTAGEAWLFAMRKLTKAYAKATDESAGNEFWSAIAIPRMPYFTIGVAVAASETSGRPFAELKRSVADVEVSTAMQSLVIDDPLMFERALPSVSGITKAQHAQFATAAAGLLQTPDLARESSAALLGAIVFMMTFGSEVRAGLAPLAKDGTLVWEAYQSDDDDGLVTGRALWLHITLAGSAAAISDKGLNPALEDVSEAVEWYNSLLTDGVLTAPQISEIASLVKRSHQLTAWITYALNDSSSDENWKNVVRAVVDLGEFFVTDVSAFVRGYDKFSEMLGPDRLTKFLVELERSKNWIEKYVGANARFVPSQLLRDLSRISQGKTSKIVFDKIDEHLLGISEQQWEGILSDPASDDLRLLIARRTTGGPQMPVGSFLPALVLNALATLRGEFDPSVVQEWGEVVTAVPKGSIKRLALGVLSGLRNAAVTGAGVEKFVQQYRIVAEKLPMETDPDTSLNQFLSFLVISDTASAKEYLSLMSKDIKLTLRNAGEDARQAFADAVNGIQDEGRRRELQKLLAIEPLRE